MAASALAVMQGCLGYNERHLDGISQTDQTIAQFCVAVKSLDLIHQMAQLADCPREPVAAADQTDIMPHDVLNRLHIPLYQCRIGVGDQAAFIPGWDILSAGQLARLEDWLKLFSIY